MPRTKARTGYRSTFWEQPRALGKVARQDLVDILCIDDCPDARGSMLKEVDEILAEHAGRVQVMNDLPRPANIAAALETIQARADELSSSLDDLDDASRSHLTLSGLSTHTIGAELTRLSDSLEVMIRKLGTHESRGAPRDRALNETIRCLVDVYDKYAGNSEGGEREIQMLRKDFVQSVLWAADIKYPESDISNNLVRRFSKK